VKEKSDANVQGHRKTKKPKPEYSLDVNVKMHQVKAVREGKNEDWTWPG